MNTLRNFFFCTFFKGIRYGLVTATRTSEWKKRIRRTAIVTKYFKNKVQYATFDDWTAKKYILHTRSWQLPHHRYPCTKFYLEHDERINFAYTTYIVRNYMRYGHWKPVEFSLVHTQIEEVGEYLFYNLLYTAHHIYCKISCSSAPLSLPPPPSPPPAYS